MPLERVPTGHETIFAAVKSTGADGASLPSEQSAFIGERPMALPRFAFYEQVRIFPADPAHAHLNGKHGVVLGRTETTDGQSWYYAIIIDDDPRGWCFFEDELKATGKHLVREDFYDGSSVRVVVDEYGRGEVGPAGNR